MVAAKEPPTFYYNKLCPFAHRAWLAITEKGLDYNPVHIDLKNKPKVRALAMHVPHQECNADCCETSFMHMARSARIFTSGSLGLRKHLSYIVAG